MSSSLYPIWFQFAACRNLDAELMFPEPGHDGREGKAVCAECPARKACLDHALETGEKHGIWGGYTPRERSMIARGLPPETVKRKTTRKPIDHGTHRGYVQHQRRHETPCPDCVAAHSAYNNTERKKLRLIKGDAV